MLTYLKVRNLAIVEEVTIEPGPGLNVLTGETGAGKSLLIDSLEFLSGARGSTEMIRSGREKLTAEAVLHLPASCKAYLEDSGVPIDGDDVELIVRRELVAGGRGRVLMNGTPLSVRELAAAMEPFLEIHGQAESHSRLAGQTYLDIVDTYGRHWDDRQAVATAFDQWKEAAAQLKELLAAHHDRTLRLDLLRYQMEEITTARLDPAEEEALRAERGLLANAREVVAATSAAFSLLDEDDESAITQTGRALHLLQPLGRQIPEIESLSRELQEITYRLQESARSLSRLADGTRHDPERLETIEERLVLLDRLKKKYGGSVEGVLEHLSRIRDEYERLADYESSIEKLQSSEAVRFEEYRAASASLSEKRKTTAHRLEKAIERELHDLAMERTTLRVDVAVSSAAESRLIVDDHPLTFGRNGYDHIEVLIAPNRGDEPRPLQKIASGGELSRLQLAIASALFQASDRAPSATLVFDEIDTGIGGAVAEVVGKKLQQLSERNQVVCVTHLPQIAAFGTTHFHVWKEEKGGETRASIRRLDSDDERVSEIARMLGGERVAASAAAHARQLLDAARSSSASADGRRRRR